MNRKRMRKTLSGFMAIVTLMSSLLSSAAFAMEEPETEKKPPMFEEIKELLDEDEIVKAKDLDVEYGSNFDLKTDFTYIEIKDNDAVKVTFEEAKNENGDEFDTLKPDIYEAVYYVEPQKTDHPMYQISRNLIVCEEGVTVTRELPMDNKGSSLEETESVESETTLEENTGEEDYEQEVFREEESFVETEGSSFAETDVETVIPDEIVTEETAVQDIVSEISMDEDGIIEMPADVEVTPVVEEGTEQMNMQEEPGQEETVQEVPQQETFSQAEQTQTEPTQANAVQEEEAQNEPDQEEPAQETPAQEDPAQEDALMEALAEAEDSEQNCNLTIISNGEVLTGAANRDGGIDLIYENRCQKGARFHLYASEDIVKEDGTVLYHADELIEKDMETDDDGNIILAGLYAGTYRITQTRAPFGFTSSEEVQEIRIAKDEENKAVFSNERQKASVTIELADTETKERIAGGQIGLYAATDIEDDDGTVIIEKDSLIDTATADAEGKGSFTADIPLKNCYYCREIEAPNRYNRNNLTTYYFDFEYTNEKQKNVSYSFVFYHERIKEITGSIRVLAYGEVLNGYQDGAFEYDDRILPGVVYEVYAAEDIFTPDFQIDENGNRTIAFAKGELAAEITTGENGTGEATDLPTGTYQVCEKQVPEGFALSGAYQIVKISGNNENSEELRQKISFITERQKVEITAVKKNSGNGSVVEGAVFGLYCGEEFKDSNGDVILKPDELIEELETGEDGKAVFTADLPLGSYYAKELKAPAGYVISEEKLMLEAVYAGQDEMISRVQGEICNAVTTTEILVQDAVSGEILDGASFELLKEDGSKVDSFTSSKEHPYQIFRLEIGETYILRESFAPYGYFRAEDQKFTIENTAEVQKITLKNDVPTALLIIDKQGEFLESVDKKEDKTGVISHLFQYGAGAVSPVTFEVFAAEDIKAADGVSDDYFNENDLVGTIETDEKGIAQLGDLPVGKYYVIEKKTAEGYVLDSEPRYVNLSYRDQDTAVVTYNEDWQNNRQKAAVNILAKEKEKERVLEGGVYGLYTAEEIKAANGNVLMEADTLIEMRPGDKDGKVSFVADLPQNGSYYVREVTPPAGFVHNQQVQSFSFTADQTNDSTQTFEFTFENECTEIQFVKLDQKTDKQITGAVLRVIDENGNAICDWTSAEKAETVKELTVGETYEMMEVQPADGYVTAKSVPFIVKDTAEAQEIVMKDDVTKVMISKIVTSGGGEIPGAKLAVLDKNDKVMEQWTTTSEAHYVERLPIGTYTIREEQAPDGYAMAVDARFEVMDTPSVQSVSMTNITAKGKLILNLTDAENEKPLKGAEFELRDKSSRVLETLRTDEAGHAESGLYEIDQTYYLAETKALDGYLPDEVEQEISFKYKGENTPIIEVILNITNKTDPKSSQSAGTSAQTALFNNPKTGDSTNLWIPLLLMLGSACMAAGIYFGKKKSRKTE